MTCVALESEPCSQVAYVPIVYWQLRSRGRNDVVGGIPQVIEPAAKVVCCPGLVSDQPHDDPSNESKHTVPYGHEPNSIPGPYVLELVARRVLQIARRWQLSVEATWRPIREEVPSSFFVSRLRGPFSLILCLSLGIVFLFPNEPTYHTLRDG